MSERSRILVLILTMTALAVGVVGIRIYTLYNGELRQERQRLVELARMQAGMLEAMAQYDAGMSPQAGPGDAFAAALEQFRYANSRFETGGGSVEFALGRREGDQMVFLVAGGSDDLDSVVTVRWESNRAEPMRRALTGQSGTITALDYTGENVLAAFQPVGNLGLGLVAKIDMAEVRAPFIRAGLWTALSGLGLLALGSALLWRTTFPLLRRLEESERRYRAIVEDQTELISRARLDTTLTFVNDAYCRYFGRPREQLLGTRFLGNIHEADRATWGERVAALTPDDPVLTIEHRVVDSRGQMSWVQWTTRVIFGLKDERLELQSVGRDITVRKGTEEALRDSEERFRQIAEYVQEVFWITSADGRAILYTSPAYKRVWGREVESLYEDPLVWSEAILAEERGRVRREFLDKAPQGLYDTQYRIARPDGAIRWIRDRGFTVRDAAGQVYRIAGIAEDITRQKQAEEQLRRALAREMEAGELRARFLAMASHDLRNPLAVIQTGIDILARYSDRLSEEDKLSKISQIQFSIQEMVELLDDILTVGRIETGRLQFEPEPVEIEMFCHDLLTRLRSSLGSGHHFDISFTGDCSTPTMDPSLLRHILNNLLSNAVKYSPVGSTIAFRARCDGDQVEFRVQDEGIGIPAAEREQLFEPFYRASNVGKVPGTGLGLAIVKQAVELHGGTIAIQSEEGKGTTFSVSLPSFPPGPA